MASISRLLALLLIATLSFSLTGCPSDTPEPADPVPPNSNPNDNDTPAPADPTEPVTPVNDNPTVNPTIEVVPPENNTIPGEAGFDGDTFPEDIPEVILSESLAATCLVNVGDTFPTDTLNDLGGTAIDLASLIGEESIKYTVIFFWNSSSSSSLQEIEDMDQEIQPEFGPQGLLIIGINEKDSPEMIQEKLEDAGADLPILLDPEGAFFDKVATEKIARTYLLDKEGKILWFDVEYSSTTRRNLKQAIEVALGKI